MKFSNHRKPTSSKYVKIGAGFSALGAAITTYSFTEDSLWLQITGIVCVALGIFIPIFLGWH